MARFFSGIQGMRGPATRLGGTASGISAFARGWNSGAKIEGHATVSDVDEFNIYATAGSNGGQSVHVATIVDGRVILNSDLVRRQVAGQMTYVGRDND